ncbi:sugar ABC transporter ATP-binding protein [Treponema parvum]|uniref:Sugar ABC transporter ATP-binding protein n=1 Tax=Treponema parvum TaxID=138851 RepID=A0A975F5A7_9SPIR|nr:sugar ABC transporter ATP-binding protein [Treponema parvum]QTQ14605.1 sugar ABC transporter ATP-binding protein [Treponema parvum]
MNENIPLLRLKGVTKDFFGTTVLEDVSFDLHKGEILGLVGENGAGKTTLMSILFGMPHIGDSGGYGGKIEINGSEVHFKSPFDALDAGIGMVHQEFSLIPGFTTTENIMLNRELTKPNFMVDIFGSRLSTLDRAGMRAHAIAAIKKLGVSIAPEMKVSEMPVGHKQFTEIAREIDREKMRILVLDEPTAVLAESESEILLKAIKELAASGIAVILISHRLQEVVNTCDRVVTLRDGRSVRDVPVSETNVSDIAASMVGRTVTYEHLKKHAELNAAETEKLDENDKILTVEHLWVDMPGETVRNVNFSVRRGEIFGIGGLAGQGKLGIPNGIMGLFPAGGKVVFDGKEIKLNDPNAVLRDGLAFVSEDRRGVGLLLDESLDWNISFTAMQVRGMFLKKILGGLFSLRDEKAMQKIAQEYIKLLDIKCTSSKQKAKELSGGNQQKVCLVKAFCMEPKLLFVSEPTRGIDVGAKAVVLDVLRRYNRENGTTIVMVSSELEELRSVCDRVAVVAGGKIAGVLSPREKAEEFALYMSGIKNTEDAG